MKTIAAHTPKERILMGRLLEAVVKNPAYCEKIGLSGLPVSKAEHERGEPEASKREGKRCNFSEVSIA